MKMYVLLYFFILQGITVMYPQESLQTRELQEIIPTGTYTFGVIKHKIFYPAYDHIMCVDVEGLLIAVPVERYRELPQKRLKVISGGNIKFFADYSDTLLVLQPVDNEVFPTVKIDLNSSIAYIGEHQLKALRKLKVTRADNMFKSAWSGYRWQEIKTDSKVPDQYRLTLAKLENEEKVYFEILWFQDGRKRHYRLRN